MNEPDNMHLCGYRPNVAETDRFVESLPIRRMCDAGEIMRPRE